MGYVESVLHLMKMGLKEQQETVDTNASLMGKMNKHLFTIESLCGRPKKLSSRPSVRVQSSRESLTRGNDTMPAVSPKSFCSVARSHLPAFPELQAHLLNNPINNLSFLSPVIILWFYHLVEGAGECLKSVSPGMLVCSMERLHASISVHRDLRAPLFPSAGHRVLPIHRR